MSAGFVLAWRSNSTEGPDAFLPLAFFLQNVILKRWAVEYLKLLTIKLFQVSMCVCGKRGEREYGETTEREGESRCRERDRVQRTDTESTGRERAQREGEREREEPQRESREYIERTDTERAQRERAPRERERERERERAGGLHSASGWGTCLF